MDIDEPNENPTVIREVPVPGPLTTWWDTEFQEDRIGLDHDWPPDLVTSQWPVKPRVYICYRILVAIVLMGWVTGDVAYETVTFYDGEAWRWLVFATNWSFFCLGITAVLQAFTVTIYEYKPYWIIDPIYIRSMPWVLRIQWIFFNMSSCAAFVVTTAYWAFIAFVANTPLLTSDMSRLKHTVNSIYVFCDVMITATPIRVYHMFFTIFAGSLYIVFNGMYFLTNGSLPIRTGVALDGRSYYFMNWAMPVEAICTCVLGIMLCAAFQIVLHLLYQFRLWLYRRFYPAYPGADAELQNIVGPSASYNSLDEAYGGRGP